MFKQIVAGIVANRGFLRRHPALSDDGVHERQSARHEVD
jgi:hypothetical protein